jgi:signal transduction histidine kinase
VLIVAPEVGTSEVLAAVLRQSGHSSRVVATPAEAIEALRHESADLVLAEVGLDEAGEARMIARAHGQNPPADLVVMARYGKIESALKALRAGAAGYLVKPVDVDTLRFTVERTLERRWLERQLAARLHELEQAHAEVSALNASLRQRIDEATEALRQRVAEAETAYARLREVQEQHDQFVRMVAHEMGGVLTPIHVSAQLAARTNLPEGKREEYLAAIMGQADRMARLVEDLRTATGLSSGSFTLRHEEFDLVEAASGVVAQVRTTHPEREIIWETKLPSLPIEGDRLRIEQTIRNLLDNAVKYSTEQRPIEGSLTREGETAVITVADYGAGIAPEDLDRIFGAFYRGSKEAESAQGSGLGLFIARGIVEAHGGSLAARNRVAGDRAHGAIFTLTLPLTRPHAAENVESAR